MMGLKSLPMLNKSGVSMYWTDIWFLNNRYKKWFLFSIHIYNFFTYILNSKKYLFINKSRYLHRLEFLNKKSKNNVRALYVGRTWLMRYHNWIIVYVRVYSKMTTYWGHIKYNNKKNKCIYYNLKKYIYKI